MFGKDPLAGKLDLKESQPYFAQTNVHMVTSISHHVQIVNCI